MGFPSFQMPRGGLFVYALVAFLAAALGWAAV
jgi:hypothetical protein